MSYSITVQCATPEKQRKMLRFLEVHFRPFEKLFPNARTPSVGRATDQSSYDSAPRTVGFDYRSLVSEGEYHYLIRHGDRFLSYRRMKHGDEKRLHDKLSLGIGGHINPIDRAGTVETNILFAAAVRELNEEVFIPGLTGLRIVGFINQELVPVDRYHVGVAFVAETATSDFRVNEPDKIEAAWGDRGAIETAAPRLETWSRVFWEHCLTGL
jgi:predicted NUDIX family phosphoesterase